MIICRHLCNSRAIAAWLVLGWVSAGAADAVHHPVLIGAAAEAAVQAHLRESTGEVRTAAEPLDARLRLPACDQPLQAALPAGTRAAARMTVAVSCPGAQAWRLHVPVRVTVMRAVVVAAMPLERGKVLAAGDVILAEREVSGAGAGYLTATAGASGRVLRRGVAAGTVIAPGLLESPLVVRRGQPVTLEVRAGGLAVQMAGIAQADGALGERIPVRNSSSKKILQGTVKNEKIVEIPIM
jgi:flagella basal body P-ring formation protein FlgA